MKIRQFAIRFVLGLAVLVAIPVVDHPYAFASAIGQESAGQSDRQIQTDLARELNKDRFKNVQVSVANGVVDLRGSVELFADKEAAVKKAHHARNAIAVRNSIHVAESKLSDKELQDKIGRKLEYDRVGYGTTAFNAITIGVREGTVILGGHAYGPADKNSALSVVSYFPGVQDVVDEIEVDPPSSMDDSIRLKVARAIYGYPSLMKYSIDPGKPIRISVQNGNVTLYGSVDNMADKETAYLRANGVRGIFKVTNELVVEGGVSERH